MATAGQVVTLTATVTSGGVPVSVGTVTFFNGSQPLGVVQMRMSDGTATLKTRFAPGSDTLTARYNGTSQIGISTSSQQPLTVTGTEPTISTLSAVSNGSNYDFTLNVFGFGYPAPTGTASLDETSQQIHLGDFTLAGPGAFTFQPPKTYATGTAPNGNAVGDFNGDGIVDLVVANFNDSTIGVLLGKADGTFQPQQTYAAPSGPLGIAVADFNGDGFADLAVTNQSNGQVSVLLGTGCPNNTDCFLPLPLTYPVGFAPNGIAVADFNGDGIADLAIVNRDGTVSVLLGTGCPNNMDCFQAQQTYAVGRTSFGVAVADFNGDGIPDLAVTNAADNTVSVLLGNGDGTFQAQRTYATGLFPRLITSGDFNRDGIVDLAVTNENDDTVSVLLGNGDGTFKAQVSYPVGSGPQGIAIADFNGDGFADLAVSNSCAGVQCQGVGTVGILLGNGDGTFQPQQQYATGGIGPLGIAIADFNGDGVPDVAANDQGSKDVSVLIAGTSTTATLTNVMVLGLGMQTVQSTYSPNTQFYSGGTSNSLQLNGTQLATTTALSSDVNPSQYLQQVTFTATVTASNNGSPTGTVSFTDTSQLLCTATLTTIGGGSVATCAASFNQIGSHMIVAIYSGDNNYLPSQGNLTQMVIQAVTSVFPQESPPNPIFGQLVTLTGTVTGAFGGTPTGTMDFIETNHQINLCLGVQVINGIAMCQTSALPQGAVNVFYSYSGDANFLDNGAFLIFQVVEAGSATTLSIQPPSPIVAGQVETLTAAVSSGSQQVTAGTVTFFSGTQSLGTVQIVTSNGVATATLKTRFAPGSDTLTARFNGTNQFQTSTSGPQSLIITGTEPTISTLTATPDGSNYDFNLNVFGFGFAAPMGTASLDETSQQIHLGDFALAGQGTPTFRPQQTFGVGTAPRGGVAAGDFNGDGCPDLVVGNQSDNIVSVLLGNCDGTFQNQVTYTVDNTPEAIAVGDFNVDGHLDLAVACHDSNAVDVLFGNGDGTFQAAVPYPTDTAVAVAVGDFNGDGLPDLASAGISSGKAGVLKNTGNGIFEQLQTFPAGLQPTAIAVGDFNGDGFLDMVVTASGSNQVAVLLGDGTGLFQATQFYSVGGNPQSVATGDFNGDGCLDLAVANFNDSTVSVLLGHLTNGTCDGTFPTQQTYPTGTHPQGIAIADFNGDGILDLAVTNTGGNTIGVLSGNGDGTFQPQAVYPVGRNPIQLAVADFAGDGVPDIAAANVVDNTVSTLLGGTVTPAQLTNITVPGQGQQTMQSTYSPNTQFYTGSASNALALSGSGFTTVTTLSADFNPSGITQAVTFTALVQGGGGIPTGTVTFTADGVNLCTAVVLQPVHNGGMATCKTSNLTIGRHTIIASYSGDNTYFPSTSIPFKEDIQKISNYVVVLTVQAQDQGTSILLTASVEPQHCDLICIPPAQVVPTGTVTFGTSQQELTSLGSAQLNGQAMASLTVTNPGALSAIFAQYLGDANFISVISNPQDSVAPPLVVQSATTSPGALLSEALNLTVDFPSGDNYFKQITCNAPIALGITCIPNPAIITSNSQANVDIRTSGSISYLRTPGDFGGDGYRVLALGMQLALPAVVCLGFASAPKRRRKRITVALLVLLACSPILMTSCGGSFAPGVPPGGSSSATPPGTYFITGTATLYKKAAAQAGGNLQIGTPQSFLIQLLVK